MRPWRPIAALVLLIALAQPARADDAADILFWNSIKDSAVAAEFEAYLRAFPEGSFVPLARIRLKQLDERGKPETQGETRDTGTTAVSAVIVPDQETFGSVERIALEVDARPLRAGSNLRLVVVPAGTPDAIGDVEAFAAASQTISPIRQRLTLPPASPGANEIRLYYLPPFKTRFELAGRVGITIEAGAPGAIVVADLGREATELGPLRFEAKYRDVPIRVAGQFLRVETRLTSPDWISILQGQESVPTSYVALYIGHLGTPAEGDGPRELVCLMPTEERSVLSRLAEMGPGDPVVLDGIATTWSSIGSGAAIVFNPCVFSTD